MTEAEILKTNSVNSLAELNQLIIDQAASIDNLNDEIYGLENQLNELESLLAEYE